MVGRRQGGTRGVIGREAVGETGDERGMVDTGGGDRRSTSGSAMGWGSGSCKSLGANGRRGSHRGRGRR